MKPVFKNRKNTPLTLNDGRVIWHARCCAVVSQVCAYHLKDKRWYILLGQRGIGVPDFQHYWGLPCGYLDWDETLCEAVVREVWEECGVFLPALSSEPGFVFSESSLIHNEDGYLDAPWGVSDRVDNPKQNISLHFSVLFAWDGDYLPQLSIENAEPNEVEALAWVEIHEASSMTLAFNHHIRIDKLIEEQKPQFLRVEEASR